MNSVPEKQFFMDFSTILNNQNRTNLSLTPQPTSPCHLLVLFCRSVTHTLNKSGDKVKLAVFTPVLFYKSVLEEILS